MIYIMCIYIYVYFICTNVWVYLYMAPAGHLHDHIHPELESNWMRTCSLHTRIYYNGLINCTCWPLSAISWPKKGDIPHGSKGMRPKSQT